MKLKTLTILLLTSGLLCGGCARGTPAASPTATATPSEFERHKANGIRFSEATAWGAAIPELEAALKLNPADADLQYHLFRCYAKSEATPNPAGPASRAARIVSKSKSSPARLNEARNYLKLADKIGSKLAGLKLVEQRQYSQAIPLLQKACQRDPKDINSRLGLFLAYANTQRPSTSNDAYSSAGKLHAMTQPGSAESLRALEYRHAAEFGWPNTPGEVLLKYLATVKNLRDPKQLVYFYPMNFNHRAKQGAQILAQQKELREKIAIMFARIFAQLNIQVLSSKIDGDHAVLRVRTTVTHAANGNQAERDEDVKMVREDGLWKIDMSKVR